MRQKKKGQQGNASNYMTRAKALSKLQLTLSMFRRLCILKGIYPRDPKKKTSGTTKTYYLTKDIQFLMHEPLVQTFRDIRTHYLKVKKARAKNDTGTLAVLERNKPTYTLDHIIRERYPTFQDALRDLDDPLNLIHLFATLPAVGKIHASRIKNCARLRREFQAFVMANPGTLVKSFVSIKGVYYQARIEGIEVTWIEPHNFSQELPADVDYRVMLTFLEFYEALLKFVNFRLYQSKGWAYPPVLDEAKTKVGEYLSAVQTSAVKEKRDTENIVTPSKDKLQSAKDLVTKLENEDEEEEEDDDKDQDQDENHSDDGNENKRNSSKDQNSDADENPDQTKGIFHNLWFFLGRETPVLSLEFVIRSQGGQVGWDGSESPYQSSDSRITHAVIDRPTIQGKQIMSRDYIQPQWVYDSVNAQCLLPVKLYGPGQPLPPHLSPFVDNDAEGYKPKFQEYIDRFKAGDENLIYDAAAHFNMQNNAIEIKNLKAQKKDTENEDEGDDDDDQVSEGESDQSEASGEDDDEEEASDEEENESEPEDPVDDDGDDEVNDSESKEKGLTSSHRPKKGTEEHDLAKMMMTKKKKRLYQRIEYSKKKKSDKVEKLMEKRKQYEAQIENKGSSQKSKKNKKA